MFAMRLMHAHALNVSNMPVWRMTRQVADKYGRPWPYLPCCSAAWARIIVIEISFPGLAA